MFKYFVAANKKMMANNEQNDQSINLTKQECESLRSVVKKIDNKKRPSDKERDRNDSNDFDNGVRLG